MYGPEHGRELPITQINGIKIEDFPKRMQEIGTSGNTHDITVADLAECLVFLMKHDPDNSGLWLRDIYSGDTGLVGAIPTDLEECIKFLTELDILDDAEEYLIFSEVCDKVFIYKYDESTISVEFMY